MWNQSNLKYLFNNIRHKHGIEIDEDALDYAKKHAKILLYSGAMLIF